MASSSSYLSPIASEESSPSLTSGDATATGGGAGASECRRALIAVECRTPSTSSQVSELDDELITTSHERNNNNSSNNIKPTSGTGSGDQNVRAASFSSTASGGSIAQQFLLHHHHQDRHRSSLSSLSDSNNNYNDITSTSNNQNHHHHHHHHQYISKLYNLKQTKRFRQILQSIPMPLAATSIITVIILCLLLSECKSLQLGAGGGSGVQSLVVMEGQEGPSQPAQVMLAGGNDEDENSGNKQHQAARLVSMASAADRSGIDSIDSAINLDGGGDDGDSSFRSIKLLRRHQNQPQHHHHHQHQLPPSSLLQVEPAPESASARAEVEAVQQQPAVEGAGDELEQQQQQSKLTAEVGGHPPGLANGFNQLELKRQILRELVQGHHRQQLRQFQIKRHSTGGGVETSGESHNQHHPAHRDNLGPILMLSAPPAAELLQEQPTTGELEQQQQPADSGDRFFSGSGSDSGKLAPEADDGGSSEDALKPAHLRSSSLELDGQGQEADRKQQSQIGQPDQRQQQQATNYRHHRYPSHLQQQQPHHYNSNNYKPMTSEHAKNHHNQQHPLGGNGGGAAGNNNNNNHDRPFDVYQIQCNNTEEGFERFACPTADNLGRFRCIEDSLFCDGYYDCPGGEDENRVSCMYYKLFVSHIDILTNTFLTWMKKQNRQQGGGHRPATATLSAD